ncbi:MAG: alpha-L-fucosidase [Planctomycetota bacterium]|nr:alpha-L-fucosidase [Planctomycetota bacterium]
MPRLKPVLLLIVVACLAASALAADAPPPAPEKPAYLAAGPEDMQWWREARFGLFIHWGPVSLKGTEIGWSRGGPRRGTGGTGEIPLEVYDNLYKEFNPTKFDANEWVAVAKAAGMKYLVFTSKHHDGFSEFDSGLTEYKITRSPFKRDVVKELADACHAAGLRLGWYYSPPDWHHLDYRTERHAKYIEYLHGQIRELMSHYGKIDILWFDGLGGSAKDWDAENLFKLIRSLQPHIIINNRAGLPADLDTPEQTIGRFQTGRAWESCITICRQWAWKPNDQMKSLKECLQTLLRCAGGDGNLLFNVGPMPTGEIEPRQVERLKEMGRWLATYGETVYGTRGGPWRPGPWGAATCKDKTVYLHIMKWDDGGVTLPAIDRKVVSAKALTGGTAEVRAGEEGLTILVPPADRQEIDTLVALTLDGPAFDAKVARPAGSVTAGKKAAASNVYRNMLAQHGPQRAVDDDDETRWATDTGVHEAWLEVDLGKPETVDRAAISEEYDRVGAFELQAKRDGQWETFARGEKIGHDLALKFAPVTAQVFRLNILKADDGPTIWEFRLFAAKR